MRREIDPTTKVQLFLKRAESPKKQPKHRVSFGAGAELRVIELSKISSEESIRKTEKPPLMPVA